ncbi:SinI family restriction endonuclease [Flavobacteriaceae bacterium D16]|nr:SinI family restriction endonuclease [Flavobacteriaceae bacterium D16]
MIRFSDTSLDRVTFDDVRNIYAQLHLHLTPEKEVLLRAIFDDNSLFPKLRLRNISTVPFVQYIARWDSRYENGYANRPSQKVGTSSATHPDQVVKYIYQHFRGVIAAEADKAESDHSIFMTIENLVGELLEEYLAFKLHPHGFYCAWGETLNKVDFCSIGGVLLQVKNSDNSENSSSSSVRAGTTIVKWFRRFSMRYNTYNWEEIRGITGCNDLNEDDFRAFILGILQTNTRIIAP